MKNEIKMIEWFNEHWYKVDFQGKVDYFPSTTTILGVTAKPFLARWRGDIGNREADIRMNEASERGTRLHNAWSVFCGEGVVLYNPFQKPIYSYDDIEKFRDEYFDHVAILTNQDEMYQMTKLEKWFDIMKPKKVITESTVFSIANRRAGTADNFFVLEAGSYAANGSKPLNLPGGLYVVDLKTGKVVDDDANIQISDYAMMLEEMAELGVEWAKELIDQYGEVVGGLVIHTGATTKSSIEGLATHYRAIEGMLEDQEDMKSIAKIWARKNKNAKPDIFDFPSQISRKKEN